LIVSATFRTLADAGLGAILASGKIMTLKLNRRATLKLLGLSAAVLGTNGVAAQAGKPGKWKTAVGLNGFQSSAREYPAA